MTCDKSLQDCTGRLEGLSRAPFTDVFNVGVFMITWRRSQHLLKAFENTSLEDVMKTLWHDENVNTAGDLMTCGKGLQDGTWCLKDGKTHMSSSKRPRIAQCSSRFEDVYKPFSTVYIMFCIGVWCRPFYVCTLWLLAFACRHNEDIVTLNAIL